MSGPTKVKITQDFTSRSLYIQCLECGEEINVHPNNEQHADIKREFKEKGTTTSEYLEESKLHSGRFCLCNLGKNIPADVVKEDMKNYRAYFDEMNRKILGRPHVRYNMVLGFNTIFGYTVMLTEKGHETTGERFNAAKIPLVL